MSAQKQRQKKDCLEKILRYALGLRPDEFGLYPDANGFVAVKDLLRALHDEEGLRGLREAALKEIHHQPGGQSPLDIQEAQIRLRPDLAALPSHRPEPGRPPKLLYIAVRCRAWPQIAEKGLGAPPGKISLKLWADKEMALKVGRRKDPEAALIAVRTEAAQTAGVVFRLYAGLLWLAEGLLPAPALSGPKVKLKPENAPPAATRPKPEPPGGFFPQPQEPLAPVKGKHRGQRDDRPDWKNQTRRERRRGGRGEKW